MNYSNKKLVVNVCWVVVKRFCSELMLRSVTQFIALTVHFIITVCKCDLTHDFLPYSDIHLRNIQYCNINFGKNSNNDIGASVLGIAHNRFGT